MATQLELKQIADLEAAIATGARKVKLGDKEIEYRGLTEMYEALKNLKRKAGIGRKSRYCTPTFSKGLND